MEGKITINLYKRVTVRQIYSTLIGIIPLISFYKVPFLDFGFSTLLVGLTAPVAVMYILNRKKVPYIVAPLCLWIAYMISRSSTLTNSFLLMMVLLHIWGVLKGSIDVRVLRKTIEAVSFFMTGIVLLQTILYYVFHFQLHLLIKNLLLADNQYYAERTFSGLYRPSGFFLEPSHYAQYCCFGLLSVLFPCNDNEKPKVGKTLWIAFGCILTTSGMGIVLCIGIFGWYILFNKKKRGEKIFSAALWMLFGVAAFLVLMRMSFFRNAVNRIGGERGAIWGRTLFWDSYIGSMSGKELLIGYGRVRAPEGFMTGLMSLIYFYGYVGVGMLALVLLANACYGKDNFTICTVVIYSGLTVISNNTGFLSYIFNLGLISASAVFARQMIGSKIK